MTSPLTAIIPLPEAERPTVQWLCPVRPIQAKAKPGKSPRKQSTTGDVVKVDKHLLRQKLFQTLILSSSRKQQQTKGIPGIHIGKENLALFDVFFVECPRQKKTRARKPCSVPASYFPSVINGTEEMFAGLIFEPRKPEPPSYNRCCVTGSLFSIDLLVHHAPSPPRLSSCS